jgi:hypothetical protein
MLRFLKDLKNLMGMYLIIVEPLKIFITSSQVIEFLVTPANVDFSILLPFSSKYQ